MTSFLNSIPKKRKSPEQIIKSTNQSLSLLQADSFETPEAKNEVSAALSKYILEIKQVLCGDADHPTVEEDKVKEVSIFIQQENLIIKLIHNLSLISFESKKDTALIYNYLIKKDIESFSSHIIQQVDIIPVLFEAYSHADIALSCGSMLRESIKYEPIARYLLYSPLFWQFFDNYLHLPNFDIASDAFNTFKDLLTMPKIKSITTEFFEAQHEKFLQKYEVLLQSDNYVTRRRSLKLLGELLLDRSHFTMMIRYISSKENLKTIMNLLRHKSPHIQFETFHVFKIFVANPKKTPEIASILYNNKVKLIAYLESFQNEKEDIQFMEEKKLLIDMLHQLEDPAVHSTSTSPPPQQQQQQPPAIRTVGSQSDLMTSSTTSTPTNSTTPSSTWTSASTTATSTPVTTTTTTTTTSGSATTSSNGSSGIAAAVTAGSEETAGTVAGIAALSLDTTTNTTTSTNTTSSATSQ